MFKFAILTLATTLSFSTSFAGDHWDNCSSADGFVRLENGQATVDGVGEVQVASVKVLKKIKSEKQTCVLKDYNQKVISYMNDTTVEEVSYIVEKSAPASKVIVICEKGGSGIPANAECKE